MSTPPAVRRRGRGRACAPQGRARAVIPALVLCAAFLLACPHGAVAKEPVLDPLAPPPGTVRAESMQDSTLFERASVRYARARFAAVVELLRPALAADTVPVADRTGALDLLGRSLVRTGDIEGGVAAFTRLLDAAPNWTLAPRRVADDERAVFDRARLAWRADHPDYVRAEAEAAARPVPHRSWYRQRRFQVATGAALVVVAAAIRNHQRVSRANAELPALPGHP